VVVVKDLPAVVARLLQDVVNLPGLLGTSGWTWGVSGRTWGPSAERLELIDIEVGLLSSSPADVENRRGLLGSQKPDVSRGCPWSKAEAEAAAEAAAGASWEVVVSRRVASP
jgi:hypothetical protein